MTTPPGLTTPPAPPDAVLRGDPRALARATPPLEPPLCDHRPRAVT
ncbi:methylmalonyl Co-A mutase-associated GTPase MeaB, partial [Azospirillum brasilense]|nr:methylmalonyl Co-A mutase-associated GTPase MeaB [Azospirillum brasilense]